MERIWSAQQVAIFERFASAQNHLVVRARAGTGKTTTIIEATTHSPKARILVAAFNKRIADELKSRLTNPHAEAKTLHAIGFAAVLRYWERVRICTPTNARANALADRVCEGRAPDAIRKMVATLHTKAREIFPHAHLPGELLDLAEQFDCIPDPEWEKNGFDFAYVEGRALAAMELAARVKPIDTGIDFADMIFLPVRNRWLSGQYDLVVVDEAQDMTVSQLEIARGVLNPGGQMVVVGDDRQAIYGFRGADFGSLDRLKAELGADELGLTTTYRCAQSIVALAKELVPDFEAAPTNPAGEILSIAPDALVGAVAVGDFVLSRKNAPLAGVAMSLVRANVRVRIAGRDIGSGLLAIMTKLAVGKAAKSIPEMLGRLVAWEDREVTRALKADREERAQLIHDQAETVRVLSEGVVGVNELRARIEALFSDDARGAEGYVTCSSVHKAKGLEANRVFILRDTLGAPMGKRKPQTAAQISEEQNIRYVAITRAKSVLTWVTCAPLAPAGPVASAIEAMA